MKHDARLHGVPVVILTGYVLNGSRGEAERAGCDLFVTKPCLPDDLMTKVNTLLKGAR